jgi:hypothetical protein
MLAAGSAEARPVLDGPGWVGDWLGWAGGLAEPAEVRPAVAAGGLAAPQPAIRPAAWHAASSISTREARGQRITPPT